LQEALPLDFGLFQPFQELLDLSGILSSAFGCRSRCRSWFGAGSGLSRSTVHSFRSFRQGGFHLTLRRHFFLFGRVTLEVFDLLFLLHQLFRQRLRNQSVEREKGGGILSADFDTLDYSWLEKMKVWVVLNNGSQPSKLLLSALRSQFRSFRN
jgi:hypothetical protein